MTGRRRRARPPFGPARAPVEGRRPRTHGALGSLAALGRLTALAALVLVTGCIPLYVPPIPAEIPAPAPADLTGDSTLVAAERTLVATLHLRAVEEPGWLTLQWYAPSLRQVASDAAWIEAGDDVTRLVIGIPDHVDPVEGRWRLVVGFRGAVLRQFEAVVGPPEPATGIPPDGTEPP